jgi:integrase
MDGNTPNNLNLDLSDLLQAVLSLVRNAQRAPFSAVIAHFRAHEMPERHSTRAAYESMLRNWIEPRWSNFPLSAIRTADIELWLTTMRCAPKTRQHRKALLHALFSTAIRLELATQNPVSLARVKGGSKRRRRPFLFTLDEFRRVLAQLGDPYRQMVLLAALLGLRASEVVALKWTDFDFTTGTLLIERSSVARRIAKAKTESSQDVMPLHEAVASELLAYGLRCTPSEEGWVFPSRVTGGPMHQDSIRQRHLRRAGWAAGLTRPLGWHTFRHSYRRWLDEAGTPLGIIKELMRHAHISTTMDVYGVGTLTPAKREAHTALVGMVLGTPSAG